MKNTLGDLNNYLFEMLERLTDDSLSEADFQREVERSKAVTTVAESVIRNGELVLASLKQAEKYGTGNGNGKLSLPPMLKGSGESE